MASPSRNACSISHGMSNTARSCCSHDISKGIFSEICKIACAKDGVTFDSDTIEIGEIVITKEYHGIRVSLMAHLDTAYQRIAMDVGFGDVITPYPQ